MTEEQRQNRAYSRNERYKAMKRAFAEQMLDLTERLITRAAQGRDLP